MAKRKKTQVREALIEQLEDKGVYGTHFYDLIEDYMSLWDIKNELIKDIKKRGVSVPWNNGPTQGGFKKNDSIADLHRTNTQMLKILDQLGISTDYTVSTGGEEDDFFS